MQGLNVGPTSNPFFEGLFNITLFNKNDFPVRYFPTKLIIPMFFNFFWFNKILDFGVIINLLFSYMTNGTASFCGIFSGMFKGIGISSKSFSFSLKLFIGFGYFLSFIF